MPNFTDVDVTNKLVELITAALPTTNVYPYVRYADKDRDDQWIEMFVNSNNDVTAWMTWRESELPSVDSFNNIIYQLATFHILGIRGIVDTGVYTTSSAGIFQGEYNTVKTAINADPTLGFGQCNISHRGVNATRIADGLFSGRLCHIAECRVPVEIYSA